MQAGQATGRGVHAPSAGTIAEQELANSLGWLIRTRWLAGSSVIVATAFTSRVLHLPLPEGPLYLLGLAIFLYNAVLTRVLGWLDRAAGTRSDRAYHWLARAQIVVDWLAMAVLITLTGGIESPAIIFFLFHVAISSVLLPHDEKAFLHVTLAPALVGAIALFEARGWLRHVSLFPPARYRDPVYVAAILVFFTCASYVMAYLSMSISRRLRRRENEIAGLYESIRTTTSTLDLGAVLEHLAEATAKVLNCQGSTIRLIDRAGGQNLIAAASYGLSEAYMGKGPLDLGRSQIDREAVAENRVLLIDVLNDPRIVYPREARAEGIRTMLVAPLAGKTGAVGVVHAYGGEGHHFTADDAAFLAAVAAQGVVAIENAQAYELLAMLDRDKSRFVRTVTHELRSPVHVAQSLLTVLHEGCAGPLTAQQVDLVMRASRCLEFLQTLVDDLLALAAGKTNVYRRSERSAVSLSGVVRDVCARFEAPASAKGLRLCMECPADPVTVWGDADDLDRMLNNLVSNAVKYTSRGNVRVSLTREEGAARLVVSDTGIGIPDKARPHVFEEFYRADNAKKVEERGTGLGLAIVKDLIERSGGRIQVTSAEGQGTTMAVFLPLAGAPSASLAGTA
jgi:signal transduction histidine kinase